MSGIGRRVALAILVPAVRSGDPGSMTTTAMEGTG